MSLGDNSTRYGTISRLLHWSMALLLLIQFASARSFEPFGLPLFAGFEGEEIAWLVAPGNLLHSWLGWLLLAMIVGHIAMVVVHRRSPGHTDVLPRMLGRDC